MCDREVQDIISESGRREARGKVTKTSLCGVWLEIREKLTGSKDTRGDATEGDQGSRRTAF